VSEKRKTGLEGSEEMVGVGKKGWCEEEDSSEEDNGVAEAAW
jgi:hypothetical protein